MIIHNFYILMDLSREVVGEEGSHLCWVLSGRLLTTAEDIWIVDVQFQSFSQVVSGVNPASVERVSEKVAVDEDLGIDKHCFMRMIITPIALSQVNKLPSMLIN